MLLFQPHLLFLLQGHLLVLSHKHPAHLSPNNRQCLRGTRSHLSQHLSQEFGRLSTQPWSGPCTTGGPAQTLRSCTHPSSPLRVILKFSSGANSLSVRGMIRLPVVFSRPHQLQKNGGRPGRNPPGTWRTILRSGPTTSPSPFAQTIVPFRKIARPASTAPGRESSMPRSSVSGSCSV